MVQYGDFKKFASLHMYHLTSKSFSSFLIVSNQINKFVATCIKEFFEISANSKLQYALTIESILLRRSEIRIFS